MAQGAMLDGKMGACGDASQQGDARGDDEVIRKTGAGAGRRAIGPRPSA